MKLFIRAVLLLISLYPHNFLGQSAIEVNGETINRLDVNNEETGLWKIFYPDTDMYLTTEFEDGKQVSATRYFRNSTLIAENPLEDGLIIYIDSDTLKVRYRRNESDESVLVDQYDNVLSQKYKDHIKGIGQLQPTYYGGIKTLYTFIAQNINKRKIRKFTGKILVDFVIDQNGVPEKLTVLSETDEKLRDEILRVLRLMPRWQPGLQNGRFVRVNYRLPISFN